MHIAIAEGVRIFPLRYEEDIPMKTRDRPVDNDRRKEFSRRQEYAYQGDRDSGTTKSQLLSSIWDDGFQFCNGFGR